MKNRDAQRKLCISLRTFKGRCVKNDEALSLLVERFTLPLCRLWNTSIIYFTYKEQLV